MQKKPSQTLSHKDQCPPLTLKMTTPPVLEKRRNPVAITLRHSFNLFGDLLVWQKQSSEPYFITILNERASLTTKISCTIQFGLFQIIRTFICYFLIFNNINNVTSGMISLLGSLQSVMDGMANDVAIVLLAKDVMVAGRLLALGTMVARLGATYLVFYMLVRGLLWTWQWGVDVWGEIAQRRAESEMDGGGS